MYSLSPLNNPHLHTPYTLMTNTKRVKQMFSRTSYHEFQSGKASRARPHKRSKLKQTDKEQSETLIKNCLYNP